MFVDVDFLPSAHASGPITPLLFGFYFACCDGCRCGSWLWQNKYALQFTKQVFLVSCAALIEHHVRTFDFLSEVLVVPCFKQAFPQQARWPPAALFSNKQPRNFSSQDQHPQHHVNDKDDFTVEVQAITIMEVLQAMVAGDLVVPGTNHGSSDYYT